MSASTSTTTAAISVIISDRYPSDKYDEGLQLRTNIEKAQEILERSRGFQVSRCLLQSRCNPATDVISLSQYPSAEVLQADINAQTASPEVQEAIQAAYKSEIPNVFRRGRYEEVESRQQASSSTSVEYSLVVRVYRDMDSCDASVRVCQDLWQKVKAPGSLNRLDKSTFGQAPSVVWRLVFNSVDTMEAARQELQSQAEWKQLAPVEIGEFI